MKRRAIIVLTLLISLSLCACQNKTSIDRTQGAIKPVTETTSEEDKSEDTISATPVPTQPIEESVTPTITESNTYVSPVILETPPFNYYLSDKAEPKDGQPLQLTMMSSASNDITDVDLWFNNNDLFLNNYEVPNSFQNISYDILPEGIATQWDDLIITSAFYDDSYIYCTYGYDFSEGYIMNVYNNITLELIYTLDFSNYRYAPEYISEDYDFIQQKINWAEIKDNILYVSQGHSTYAKSSINRNAYITAIDLSDMTILWRTDPLISNAYNFLIIDDVIISGYGFTAEPDYLYQIDISSGKVLDQLPLKTAAEYIIKKDNVLYVRTYDMNYEFEINH